MNPVLAGIFIKKSNGQDYTYEWEKISELLLQLYESTKLKALREKIVDYIFSKFNLIEDEWKFWHYTPPSIFKIILLHFKSSPKDSISKLVPIFSNQFNQFYKQFGKQLEFKGWEHMGSGISQSGSEFSIQDRYFVGYILKPLILGFYEEDKDVCWKFLADHYIAPKIDDVSINKPDFMNRASLPVVFREYKDGIHTNEAYEVLSNFVRMRKGIPWKADLVFQELRGDYSDDQKWAVVKVSLEEFNNLPVNVFVEQIVADLAKKEHKEALKTIASWVGNPEYNRRQSIGSFSVMENIAKLLDNPKTFDDGVVIYTNYITSEEFVKKVNDWNTWDVAKILAKIITLKPDAGVKLLKTVISSKVLTENQQTLICSSVNNLTTDNKQLLDKVYQEFVLPLLQEQDYDIVKIEKRITNRHSREQLVQFAEKLAESTLWNEAFSIIKIFIDDSDPILGNYPEDEKGDFNEHEKVIAGEDSFTIRTVRGWCAWVLQKLFIPKDFSRISETRKIIEQALPLLEKLINDPNYYVRIQATVPLSALARNRNTVLPENPKERFISLEVAAKTKSLAFKMLKDPTNHKLPSVMKHLAMTFTYVRSLTQEEAWEVLQTFLKDEYPKKKRERGHESHIADVLSEAAPLYIFFAFYRAEAFKNWPKEWEDLGKFDDKPFKELLRSMLRNSNAEIRRVFTWQLARLPNEVKDKPEFESTLNLAADYLMLSTQKYDHSTFENIYRFIEDYIDKDNYFDICFRLWTACIKTEKKIF
ncbi:MAG: hypothetical protein UZ21_OP11001000286 [Microgenomates bacterium OLB22]|nr:MAG: hypothetical protein UZ21_OP11001000286 [Microgenomates bacterium OLB22]